ncbi:MAG: hypothetical protein RLZZ455_367 [Candidatus Parcubacteria bacterium]|jgi:SAM-dependent methyltransferase
MKCVACGSNVSRWIKKEIISDELAKAWNLTSVQKKKFNLRESLFCPVCKNSLRTRALAEAIIKTFPYKNADSLAAWSEHAKKKGLEIAEINSCGNLHPILKKIPSLSYSEYQPSLFDKNLITTAKNIVKKLLYHSAHEDITRLSYTSNSFDLVIHSETLEHIPDVKKAVSETKRILKPGGICIFTIPIIPERKTLKKINTLKTHHTPSYHGFNNRIDYLVCWEFGGDFITQNKLKTVVSYPENMMWVFSYKK